MKQSQLGYYSASGYGYIFTFISMRTICGTVLLLALLGNLLFSVAQASALTTVPTKMNFQGRLTDASGNIKPNGTYNMKLKLYTVSTAGSSVWSEDRLVSATQGVTVTNGLFSIQLGEITTLPANLFASGALYLEVELPTPASATTSSPVWSEGPMTPRNQMATSAYAYNAETLDGLDSASFGQLATSNTWTGVNLFRNTTNSTAAFSLQDSTNNVLFNADTTNKRVTVGGGPGNSTARVHIEGPASTAAMTWTVRVAAEINFWYSITYGNGLFVAVSADGTNRVQTSPDGITWTARATPELNTWRNVTYGNGLFVAVSQDGTNRVMTSPDGITWTARAAAELNNWRSVTYGNGLFVAVSGSGTNRVMTSPDGITWTARAAAQANFWLSVTYANGLFVAVSMDGTNRVQTSPDGITWTARTAAEANAWYSVTYGNGLFVAVADSGTNRVQTSPDGITWTARAAAEANAWRSVTYGNGLFVAVADSGTNRVQTSPDGITWTARAAPQANTWNSVIYGNGLFVALSTGGTNRVMTSGDIALTTRGAVQVTGDISSTGDITSSGSLNATGLTVTNQSSQGYVAAISNTSSATTADGLLIKLGVANASRTTSNYFVGFSDSAGVVAGKIQGGVSAVAYTTTAADYAEYFKADPTNMPTPGQLVALDPATPNGVKHATIGDMVVGVVSTSPGFVGNGPLCQAGDEACDANYAKAHALVSLVGQVPLNVTGDIQPGDALGASTIPGVAQKVTKGAIVGYALTTATDGTAQVLVRPGVLGDVIGSDLQGGNATLTSLVVSGLATVDSLQVVGNAYVGGSITVNGHIVSGGKTPDLINTNGACVEAVIEGNDVAGSISLTTKADCQPSGKIMSVKFSKEYSKAPRVVLSPSNDMAAKSEYYKGSTTQAAFELHVASPLLAGTHYGFDYMVIE